MQKYDMLARNSEKVAESAPVMKKVPTLQVQGRIDSWKSIAGYLGRSLRTIQRWHTEYGLPVHRAGAKTGSVYAYAEELDQWLRGRTAGFDEGHAEKRNDEAVGSCSSEISVCLTPLASKARSDSLLAQASQLWSMLSTGNVPTMTRLFREAADLDPGNAEAFAGLSLALTAGGLLGSLRIPAAYAAAKAALARAFELAPESPKSRSASAWLKTIWERDWQGARGIFDQLLRQDSPSSCDLLGRALLYVAEQAPRAAAALALKVSESWPLNSFASALHCWSEYLAGAYGAALAGAEQARARGEFGQVLHAVEGFASLQLETPEVSLRRVQALSADYPMDNVLRGVLGYAYGISGQSRRAEQVLEELNGTGGGASGERFGVALVLIGLEQSSAAVEWLGQSYRAGSLWSLGFVADPILRSIRRKINAEAFVNPLAYPSDPTGPST